MDCLGYGSMEDLKVKLPSLENKLNVASPVLPLLGLVPAALQQNSHGLAMDATVALRELGAAPMMADLEEWMQWEVRCKAELGPLRSFVQQHGKPLIVLICMPLCLFPVERMLITAALVSTSECLLQMCALALYVFEVAAMCRCQSGSVLSCDSSCVLQ